MNNGDNLEIERKFLLRAAPDPSELTALGARELRMEQVYLRAEGDGAARVRHISEAGVDTYFHTVKRSLGGITRSEVERQISADEYRLQLVDADPGRGPVRKTRFTFPYADQVIELDVFEHPRRGLALVEVELASEEQQVVLPPWLEVAADVSDDGEYMNANLAREAATEPSFSSFARAPEQFDALLEVYQSSAQVMALLEEHGPDIVPHLIDTDDNAGQRLREAIEAVRVMRI